jgi:hypothetical protein
MTVENEAYWTVFEILDLTDQAADRVRALDSLDRPLFYDDFENFFEVVMRMLISPVQALHSLKNEVSNLHLLRKFLRNELRGIIAEWGHFRLFVRRSEFGGLLIYHFERRVRKPSKPMLEATAIQSRT